MTAQRLIVQMGMGVGDTPEQAVHRAVSDAMARARTHSDVPFEIRVTISLPDGLEVDTAPVRAALGHGVIRVSVVPGGLRVPAPGGELIVANAALERFPKALPEA